MSTAYSRARAVFVLATLMVLGLWAAHPALTPVVSADAIEVDIVGHIGGASLTVDVQGDYAYVGEGTQLTVLDVSNPAAPVVAGKSPVFLDVVQDVTVEGNLAYVALGYEGLAILDVTNPSAPIIVGTLAMPLYTHASEIVVAGQYAYVADRGDGLLMMIDVANPAAPSHTGSTYIGDNVRGLAVAGDYAYVITPNYLLYIDVTDPEDPFVAYEYGFWDVAVEWSGEAEDMAVAGGFAFILTTTKFIHVLDVTDPESPVGVGMADVPQYSLEIAVAGDTAYVVDYWGGLTTVDINDPANPAQSGYLVPRQDLPNGGNGVVVAGDLAFFNDPEGMRIADISDPGNPVQMSTYDTLRLPPELTVAGDYVYVTAGYHGLIIIDAADPARPSRVGSYDTPGYAREVVVSGDYAYVTDSDAGLQIIDVTDPTAPSAVGSLGGLGETMSLDVEGNYAYVTAYLGGYNLRVIDVSDPANPVQVGSLPTPGYSWNVDVVGQYAYVVNAHNLGGFVIVDVSNPAGPVQVGSYGGDDVYFHVYSMKVVGDLAYLAADYYGGLRIVNVADPSAPVDVGSYDTPGAAYDLAVSGPYVYVANEAGGLRIIDVTDPELPVEVAYNDTIVAYNVVVGADHVFALHDWSGLYILEAPANGDNDGPSDETEDGAPNGGDGNNDGIPDSQQANVASLPNSENNSYITLAAPPGIELVNVQATVNPSPGDTPAEADFPVGFLDFEIEGIAPGEAVSVTIILHGGETVNSYYKYGPEPGNPADHWYAFNYDGTTGAEFPAGQIVLHLVDGDRGDSDLTANGVIVDPGAPAVASTVGGALYVSGTEAGTAGGVGFDNRDILAFNTGAQTWSMHFDGSDVGIKPLSAFTILEDDSLVMAFKANVKLPGLGTVMPHDLVRFVPSALGATTSGAFEWYLDGSDVGLTKSGERIDAVDVLPDGRVLISPAGAAQVGPGSKVSATKGDLLALTPTQLGPDSAGVWAKYFDDSTVAGLASENVAGAAVDAGSGAIYLTITNAFTIGGVSGGAKDVLRLEPDGGGGFTVHQFWNGPANGFLPTLGGIELGD